MTNNVNGLLGISAKAGKVVSGSDAVLEKIMSGKVYLTIVAEDASEKTIKNFKFYSEKYNVDFELYGTIENNSKTIEISEKNRQWNDNLKAYTYQKSISKIPKDFDFSVTIYYEDLLNNCFTQALDFTVHYVLEEDEICGNIELRHVNEPEFEELI